MIGLPLLAGFLAMAISGFANGEVQALYRSVTEKLQRRATTRKNFSYWLLVLAYVGIVILLVIMAVRRTTYKKPRSVVRFDLFHPTYELVVAARPATPNWWNPTSRRIYPIRPRPYPF